ncbi:MAG TPA: hypothetical protein VGG57_18205 [Stellaceae bacterium]|jgi:hypothetical protein
MAALFFFLPRVTVEPSGPYDPANPSSVTFTISNINIVPLRDVQPELGLCFIGGKGGDPPLQQCNGSALSKLDFTPWKIKWLDVDEKYQIALEDMFRIGGSNRQIENADITIGITYTPWRMPAFWRNTKEFRFITKKMNDGKIYWLPTPLNR